MQTKIKKTHFAIIVVALVVLVAASGYFLLNPFGTSGDVFSAKSSPASTGVSQSSSKGLSPGNKAPDFEVTTVDGKKISLASLIQQKKPFVLYFFASWCPFCTDELTRLKGIYPDYQDKVGFVAVDLDLQETEETVTKYKLSHQFLGDFAAGNRDILINYMVIATTTKYFIDSDGVILTKGSGEISDAQWKALFQDLVNL